MGRTRVCQRVREQEDKGLVRRREVKKVIPADFLLFAMNTTIDANPVVHSLPVQTTFIGTTDVENELTSAMVRDDAQDGQWKASLRGRTIVGQNVQLPTSHALALVHLRSPVSQKSIASRRSTCYSPTDGDNEIELLDDISVLATASEYLQWEHARPPDGTAALGQWIALSSIIHSPCD